LDVLDYTLGTNRWIRVQNNSGSYQLTEGIDFTAQTSNEATAQAIANAWNSDTDRVVARGVRAVWRGGNRVAFVALNASTTDLDLTSNFVSAWDEVADPNPTPLDVCSWDGGTLPPALSGYLPIVNSISGLEWGLNPVTRETKTPLIELHFADGAEIRELLRYYQLRRVAVDIYLGTYDLTSFNDFMRLPTLHVEDVIPKYGQITVKLADANGDVWRDRPVRGRWTGWHPLQVVRDVLIKAGAGPDHYVDSTLDYETADPSRSHFCISRYDDQVFGFRNPLDEAQAAGELVTELIALMSGTWRPTQTGPYEFRRFDYNAAVARQWSANYDIDEIAQDSSLGDMVNSVTVSFGRREDGQTIEFTDTDAVSFLESNGILSDFQHRSDWINSVAQMGIGVGTNPEILDVQYVHGGAHTEPQSIYDDTIAFPVQYASRQGFCGTQRVDGSPSTLAPGMSLGAAAGRYVVLRTSITNAAQRDPATPDQAEYILIDQWNLHQDLPDDNNVQAAPQPPIVSSPRIIMADNAYAARITNDDPDATVLPNGLTLREFFGAGTFYPFIRSGRCVLGSGTGITSPPNWHGYRQYVVDGISHRDPYWLGLIDVTIPFYMAREIVRRFKNGAPKLKVRTDLSQIDIEIGDFINIIDDDLTVSYLRGDGADGQVAWEVTGKKIEIFGDSPGIEWELVFVRDSALDVQDVLPALAPPPVGSVSISTEPDVYYFEDSSLERDGDVLVDGGGVFTVG
jgi:hypothetical protein